MNEYPYSRYINESTELFKSIYNQDSNGFTKLIEKDYYMNGEMVDVIQTTGLNNKRSRVNFSMTLRANQLKALKKNNLQVECTPNSRSVKISLAGITITASNNPLSFRPKIIDNIASSCRFYNKKWSSLGDSTVASGGWQTVANRFLGTEHINRGIEGTTIANTGRTAYVNTEGDVFDDRNNAPTTGVEGGGWFRIEISMCLDSRISTMPADSSLITLTGGINDYGNDVKLGNITDEAGDSLGGAFYAACKSFVEKTQKSSPNAILVNIVFNFLEEETSFNNLGFRADDY